MPAIVLACSALALAAEPTNEELKNQIDALQRKLEALEARQTSAADVDATVARVLKDAEARSQLMQAEGFTAGYNKGKFTLQTPMATSPSPPPPSSSSATTRPTSTAATGRRRVHRRL